VSHLEAPGQLSQLLAASREEATERSAVLELFHPDLPALGTTANAIEDTGELCRSPGLALAKEPPGLIDQEQIEQALTEQERASDTVCHAVVPASDEDIDPFFASDCHGRTSDAANPLA
jgi:hypothetical protein